MKKKNGFTLVEMIAVIIILGIIMVIAVPAVSKYILNSNDATYAGDIQAFVETIRSGYEMEEYGPHVKEGEIMIVPIENVEFEKGESKESPYGAYDLTKSYVLIVPERNGYEFYANVVDVNGIGVVMKKSNELNKDAIEEDIALKITSWNSYKSSGTKLVYNKKTYSMCEVRDIDTPEFSANDAIVVMCEA